LKISELENLISQFIKIDNKQKLYKLIYKLKNKGYLLALKKDLFFVKKPSEELDVDEIIEKYYRKLLKEKIKESNTKKRYIG